MHLLVKRFVLVLLLVSGPMLLAQETVNPIIKNFGGIKNAPHAVEKPDPNKEYKIVIDVATGERDKSDLSWALNNVARLLNLHAMGGVPKQNLNVVLAIHGGAVFTVLDNAQYKEKFGVDNPNLQLIQELEAAGVDLFVCSQSLMGRGLDHERLVPEAKVATAMLTVMSTYQLQGYAALKF